MSTTKHNAPAQLLSHDRAGDLTGEALTEYVNSLTRDQVIEWLCWNDPNGIYRDEEYKADDQSEKVLTLDEVKEMMIRQITSNQ